MADKHNPFGSISTTWHGQAVKLDDAIDNAWENAKKSGATPGTYRILDISFNAENPITEYSVLIGHI